MFKHKIYIYTSPKAFKRIGLAISNEESEAFKALPEDLIELCQNYNIATHKIFTNDHAIESTISFDPFFEDIELYRDINHFTKKVKNMNIHSLPTAFEFSKILLTRMPLDKLQLQKVLYLIYSICLEKGKKYSMNLQ